MDVPSLRRCCICNNHLTETDVVYEERPTGVRHSLQTWAYCGACWDRHREICRGTLDIDRLTIAIQRRTGRIFVAPR